MKDDVQDGGQFCASAWAVIYIKGNNGVYQKIIKEALLWLIK